METKSIARTLGIVIVVVMALSMLAGAFLYVDRTPDTSTGTQTDNPVPQDQTYNYSASFDANAIKELGSIEIAAPITSIDKAGMDSAVMRLDGVSQVSSQFKKNQVDSNSWIYLAELSLKKDANVSGLLEKISALTYFGSAGPVEAMKYMTISVPASVILHNTDLNTDRNFSFPTTTLGALVNTTTIPGDELLVNGTMQLKGNSILSLQLFENINITREQQLQDMINAQLDQNKPLDQNAPKDANVLSDTNKP